MKKASEVLESGEIADRYLAAVFILRMSDRQDFDYFVSRYGLSLQKLIRVYNGI